MKKIFNEDKILISIMVTVVLSFLKFVITVSIGNDFTPLFDVLIIDICILAILYIFEELVKLKSDNKKPSEETEDNKNV